MIYKNVPSRSTKFVFSLVFVLCVFCGHQLIKIKALEQCASEINESDGEDWSLVAEHVYDKYKGYPLFQPNEAIDFPTVTNRPARIPHIIHQIADSEFTLELFAGAMRSFVNNNPAWQYRFWTYESGRNFLESHFHYLLEIYDKFGKNNVRKSDLLRYAVIYEFGGIYADLDVENLRPLDRATMKYACIIPVEPFEHSAIGYTKDIFLSSSILLCRPKHPFFEQLLLNLRTADPNGHPVITTGPWFLTRVFMLYNGIGEDDLRRTKSDNSSNSPYFYKGTKPEDGNDSVYIPNSQYFMDSIDRDFFEDGELTACIHPPKNEIRIDLINRACNEFESRRLLRENRKYAFTHHYWFHMWLLPEHRIKSYRKMNIKDIIPNCIFY